MKNIEDLNNVLHIISCWLTTIKSHNAVGFFDINRIAQVSCVKLLNAIYGYHLENLEDEKINFPSIDLGDEINKIGFQISTRMDTRKFYESLEKFVKGPIEKYTNGIRFLILSEGKKPRLNKTKCQKIYPKFDPIRHTITVNDLLKEIKKYGIKKMNVLIILKE